MRNLKFYNKVYRNLGFYVKGKMKQFHHGEYTATTDEEIEVLKSLQYVTYEEEASQPAAPSTPGDNGEHDPDLNGDGKLTVTEIKAELERLEIPYTSSMKKSELLALLEVGE